ncbi:hypothetical protein [Inquilinus sp. OTU3971]|uniref:hypothetical protein n=1 Tax=Inquilinus sp. OTU3971 TaxID=3043855 RepID=UPI00313DA988
MLSRSARRGLSRLMLRWPARRAVLANRAETNDEFASLCEIYAEAHDALETWLRSDHSLADARAAEYRELVAEIEGEILDKLAVCSDKPGL